MESAFPPIVEHYQALVARGRIEHDPHQAAVVARLDKLREAIDVHRLAKKSSALGWMFGARRATEERVKGLYIWGSVGRGKTMLMDMFFESVVLERKRRVHFHAFMADVHRRIHRLAAEEEGQCGQGRRPDRPVADALAEGRDAAVLRRVRGHGHRRRHDPRTAVPGAVRRAT